MRLSDIITPDPKVPRSINLERDNENFDILSQYCITGKALEVVDRFVSALNGERINAWSLTGPYGMGKSAFVNYLLALCGPVNRKETINARMKLKAKDIDLYNRFMYIIEQRRHLESGFLRIPVTASFEPINYSLVKGLKISLERLQKEGYCNQKAFTHIQEKALNVIANRVNDPSVTVEIIKDAAKAFGAPVIIAVDELGKSLEYMARHPAHGDLYILQLLAESTNVYIFACLHQAFEDYTIGFTKRQKQEWGKIQGRFEDISFIEPRSQMIEFITSLLLRRNDSNSLELLIGKWSAEFIIQIKDLGLEEFITWDPDFVKKLFPLHPLVAIVLPELCSRFAQNDRTLFSFLCGGEPNALPNFLSQQKIDFNREYLPTYTLDLLYDYFLESASNISLSRVDSHKWIEVHDIIERSNNLPPLSLSLLKTIGLLNIVSGAWGLRASKKMLSLALLKPLANDHFRTKAITNALKDLIQKGVLIYRKYADEYRLWEGTDFDIAKAIREHKARLAIQDLDEVLEQSLPLMPISTPRHFHRTGTLRHFEQRWCSAESLQNNIPACTMDDADGLVLYCFGNNQTVDIPSSKTQEGKPLIVVYADCEEQIRDMVLETKALKEILTTSPEIARDGVARKEVKFRAKAIEERLRRFINEVYSPGNTGITWYADSSLKEISTYKQFSVLVSSLSDNAYSKCPVIHNELINRNKLSSATARARRELMEFMFSGQEKENLGMQGTGPEVAIYRTMLLAEKLHQKNDNGQWQFYPPKEGSNYYNVWKFIEERVAHTEEVPVRVSELLHTLRNPPFGMKSGPIPILLCLFLIINSDTVGVYYDGAFVPYFGIEEMELLAKRPERFSMRRFSPIGIKAQIFKIYRNLLNIHPISQDTSIRNATILSVVGPLVQFANSLVGYSRTTRLISHEAQRVRHVLLQASDPIRLLFKDLPEAVGLHQFNEEMADLEESSVDLLQKRLKAALVELAQSYQLLIERIKKSLQTITEMNTDFGELRKNLILRSQVLTEKCSDNELRPFVQALSNSNLTDKDWAISLATIATQKPVDAWRDNDFEVFQVKTYDLFQRFFALEAIVGNHEALSGLGENKEARFISVTWPNGKTSKEIVSADRQRLQELQEKFKSITNGLSNTDLQGLLILMSEHLFSKDVKESKVDN